MISDKEEIRPLYREFKKLESQIADAESAAGAAAEEAAVAPLEATTATADVVDSETQPVTDEIKSQDDGGDTTPAPAEEPFSVQDAGTVGVEEDAVGSNQDEVVMGEEAIEGRLIATKAERDLKKREIKSWIKEFEEREGRTPTAE